jgi:hypothetical protein
MDARTFLQLVQQGAVAGGQNNDGELVLFFASNDGSEVRIAIADDERGFPKVVRHELIDTEGEIQED